MDHLINKNGITIKQLKEFVKDLPEIDENGDDFELWAGGSFSNVVTEIWPLNKGDLIIITNEEYPDPEKNEE